MELIKLIFSLVYTFITTFFATLLAIVQTPAVIILLCIVLIVYAFKIMKYRKTVYYEQTKCSYFRLQCDKGRLGEYRTYMNLRKYEQEGAKFLFNVYIPKEDGQTTEIDVLMITEKGIFVFESKNYSGWIFGSDNQKNWYQTLPVGKGRKSLKENFLNPIMQNRLHIKSLKIFLDVDIPMYSVVVFSNRCTFKGVDIKSDEKVIHREDVFATVTSISKKAETDYLKEVEIKEIFDKLYPCSQVDASVKEKHIENIKNTLSINTDNSVSESTIEEMPKVSAKVEETEKENIEQKKDNDLICPKCGGVLVLRTATKGANAGKQFYGCSNFPRCRYLQSK